MHIMFALAAVAPVLSAPSPPPVVLLPPTLALSGIPSVLATLDVELRADGEVLWSGPMRVSNRSGAGFNRQKYDAPANACVTDEISYSPNSVRSSLSVNINMPRIDPNNYGFEVRVNWDRPGRQADCNDIRRGTRTIALTERFALAPKAGTVLTGDGGLTVRIRRRD